MRSLRLYTYVRTERCVVYQVNHHHWAKYIMGDSSCQAIF